MVMKYDCLVYIYRDGRKWLSVKMNKEITKHSIKWRTSYSKKSEIELLDLLIFDNKNFEIKNKYIQDRELVLITNG